VSCTHCSRAPPGVLHDSEASHFASRTTARDAAARRFLRCKDCKCQCKDSSSGKTNNVDAVNSSSTLPASCNAAAADPGPLGGAGGDILGLCDDEATVPPEDVTPDPLNAAAVTNVRRRPGPGVTAVNDRDARFRGTRFPTRVPVAPTPKGASHDEHAMTRHAARSTVWRGLVFGFASHRKSASRVSSVSTICDCEVAALVDVYTEYTLARLKK